MAKRAAPDEQPYRPLLDVSLVSAVSQPKQAVPSVDETISVSTTKIVEMTRPESARKIDPQPVRSFIQEASSPTEVVRQQIAPQQLVEKLDQEKRILFTRAETQAIDRLVTSLATRLNAQVKVSHVMRALVGLLLHAEGEVDKRAGETGAMVRPPNGDAKALQRFEKEIGNIIASALRDAGPLRG